MKENIFWEIIGEYLYENGESAYYTAVVDRLSAKPMPDIYSFEILLQQKTRALCNWNCYGVFCLLETISDDHPFQDFRLWIIAQGVQFYDSFLENPELVAEDLLKSYHIEDFYLEGLCGVALQSILKKKGVEKLSYYKEKTFLDPRENGYDKVGGYGFIHELTGDKWDSDDELKRRFPKIFDATEGEFLRQKEEWGL